MMWGSRSTPSPDTDRRTDPEAEQARREFESEYAAAVAKLARLFVSAKAEPYRLPAYNERQRCPKCAYDAVTTKLDRNQRATPNGPGPRMYISQPPVLLRGRGWFETKQRWIDRASRNWTPPRLTPDAPLDGDVLLRTCARCGWSQYQAPLDVVTLVKS